MVSEKVVIGYRQNPQQGLVMENTYLLWHYFIHADSTNTLEVLNGCHLY